MRLITAPNGLVVKIFGAAKEMPGKRYLQFQKRLLLMAGVGSDLDAISGHFSKLYGYVAADMKTEALAECENVHYSIYSVLNGIDFTSLAFACLVYSIGDEITNDLSEEGLQLTSDNISELGISIAEMEQAVEDVKKKIGNELKQLFPRLFPEDSEYAFYEKLKQKILLQGDLMLSGDDDTSVIKEKIEQIHRFFMEINRPMCFKDGHEDNCLVDMERSFGSLCAMLDNNGSNNSQEFSLFDLYARLDYLSRPAKT